MERIGFFLLGTLRLDVTEELRSLDHRRGLALLAYLVVTQKVHRRESLATLIDRSLIPPGLS